MTVDWLNEDSGNESANIGNSILRPHNDTMNFRKEEITPETNERDFPQLVEITVPLNGVRDRMTEFAAFHAEHAIVIRRGRGRHSDGQFYMRWCFADAAVADAFKARFGGERLAAAPIKRPGTTLV